MDAASPFTREQANSLWQECLPEVAWLISYLLREVGLPAPGLQKPTIQKSDTSNLAAETYRVISGDDSLLSDILQTVFEHYWCLFNRADSPAWLASPRGCLFRIVQRATWHARNDALRSKRQAVSIEGHSYLRQELPDGNTSSEETTVRHERLALINDFLSGLEERDRRILLAKLERSYAPAARALGATPGSLRTRACRLWARFQNHIRIHSISAKRSEAA
jgi:DNA-directed RNA polymerase specialized sigma24 family protein